MKLKGIVILLIILLVSSNQGYALELKSSNVDIGTKAQNFTLEGYAKDSEKERKWKLEDFHGKWVVLYFYPKDFTQGCTIEARNFERLAVEFNKRNAEIVGISNDPANSHESFCNKERLSLILLSDNNGRVSKTYQAWNEPYSSRDTFLIDPEGFIRYRWINVRPSTHPKEVLGVLNNILEE